MREKLFRHTHILVMSQNYQFCHQSTSQLRSLFYAFVPLQQKAFAGSYGKEAEVVVDDVVVVVVLLSSSFFFE